MKRNFRNAVSCVFVAAIAMCFFSGPSPLFAADYDMLPTAQITIDGNAADWAGITPVADPLNDTLLPHVSGTDIERVYMALNSSLDTLYVCVDLRVNPNTDDCTECDVPSNGFVQYLVAFDDPDLVSWGTWNYDWQVGFNNGGFWVWDLQGQKDYDNTDNLTEYTYAQTDAAFAVGTVVEFSIPLAVIGNPFKIASYVYLMTNASPDEELDHLNTLITTRTLPFYAEAGEDATCYEGGRITLDGTGTTVSGGDIVTSYAWKQTSGTSVFLMKDSWSQSSFAVPFVDEGDGITLTFRLTATTRSGRQDQDEIVFFVYDNAQVSYPSHWNEAAYLSANADVAAVITPNGFSSGYEHFMMYGRYEDRRGGLAIQGYPDYWDESTYKNENQDIASAVFNHYFNNAYEHYMIYGQAEGRIARTTTDLPDYWNESGYLAANADVAAVVQAGWFTNGFEHYMNWGRYEGRRGGLGRNYPDYWDEHGYLTMNSDVAGVVMSGFFKSGYEHYLIYGETEGRRGGL